MKSNILLTVYTLIICQSAAQRAFCPVKSPSNQVIYFTDKPSWSATSLLKTQCTMECSFCSIKQTCGDCRAFNYNSTSRNCSIFNFEPKSYDIDLKGSIIGYQDSELPVPGFWPTIPAEMCVADDITKTNCSHVYKADQYCGIDRYFCRLPNGTEAFCIPDNSTTQEGLLATCSFPFTYNGTLYFGCAPGVGCLTVNRTSTMSCNTERWTTLTNVVDDALNIDGQELPIQSIFGWIIWMRKTGYTFNWNSTWTSYKNGFGSYNGSNFWLGLKYIHMLTSSANYRLRVEMKIRATGEWLSVEYWSFKVGDELSLNYQLNVDGFSGDTGNGMQYVNQTGCFVWQFPNGMKFTTYDKDNDHSPINCAAERGGGWWFYACSRACLTCNQAFFWWPNMMTTPDDCAYNILTEVHMMIKLQ